MDQTGDRVTLSVDGREVGADVGQSLADALKDAGVIEARCGGAMACATCAVSLGAGWPDADRQVNSEEEAELLDLFDGTNKRLACQVLVSRGLAVPEVLLLLLDP